MSSMVWFVIGIEAIAILIIAVKMIMKRLASKDVEEEPEDQPRERMEIENSMQLPEDEKWEDG